MRQIADGDKTVQCVSVNVDFNSECSEAVDADGPEEAAIRAARRAGLDSGLGELTIRSAEYYSHFAVAMPVCIPLLGSGEVGTYGQKPHPNDYDFNDFE